MNTPKLCTMCYAHYLEDVCPHCQKEHHMKVDFRSKGARLPMALLLGFGLTGCPDKEDTGSVEDTSATEPASEVSPEPADAPLYGVPEE